MVDDDNDNDEDEDERFAFMPWTELACICSYCMVVGRHSPHSRSNTEIRPSRPKHAQLLNKHVLQQSRRIDKIRGEPNLHVCISWPAMALAYS